MLRNACLASSAWFLGRRWAAAVLLPLPLLGSLASCSDSGDPPPVFPGGGSSSADAGDTGSPDTSQEQGEAGAMRLDVLEAATDAGSSGPGGPDGEVDHVGCKRADVLFVVDNSRSMATKQAELIESVPEFIRVIAGQFENAESYHIAVVTSDAYQFNEPGCTDIGAFVTETSGRYSSWSKCGPFVDGYRFLSENDDVTTEFDCIARVGIDGENTERMMEAATRALSADMLADGACNAGFLREESLLVLVLVTDEDDPGTCSGTTCPGSPGDPRAWYDAIVAAKGGKAEDIVVIAIVRGAPGNVCQPPQGEEREGTRVMEFARMFGSGALIGDICADSYGTFLSDAVAVITETCPFVEG